MSYACLKPGETFGRLTVICQTSERNKRGDIIYRCQCQCGKEKLTTAVLLHGGHVKSCGCLRKDVPNRLTHRMSETREYRIWAEMRKRCTNRNQKTFSYYGGRGIAVCDRWSSFENFFKDMGKCPAGFSIDRIDTNGNYEPSNCRWVDLKTQARNKRTNHLLTFNGKTQCISAWAEEIGIKRDTLKRRIYLGWSTERALTEGVKK